MRAIVPFSLAALLVAGCSVDKKPAADTAAMAPMMGASAAALGDSAGMPANMPGATRPSPAPAPAPAPSAAAKPAPAPPPAAPTTGTSLRPGSGPAVPGAPGRPTGAMMTRPGAELLNAEQRLTTAVEKHDQAAAEALVAAGYPDRAHWMNVYFSNTRVTSALFANPQPGSVGDQGTVVGDFYWTAMRGETKIDETLHVRDSWTLRGGAWKLSRREVLSRHAGPPVVKPNGKL